MLSRVAGFRRLFDEGEEDTRARFAEQHDIFSQYLPYAIVFGCTKKWAKAFEGSTPSSSDAELVRRAAQPFNALVLASAIDHFGTAATGTMYASMPSSSSSSGFCGAASRAAVAAAAAAGAGDRSAPAGIGRVPDCRRLTA